MQTQSKRSRVADSDDVKDENANKKQHRLDLVGILEGDIGHCVLGFLNRRELFNMTFTSKSMMGKLSYRNVVRSGMMHSHSKTTVTRIVESLDKIYVPSPLRLLRLINGRICENCKKSRVQQVFGEFGVYMCKGKCMDRKFLVRSDDNLSEDETNLVLAEPVSHHKAGSRLFLWKEAWMNRAGERWGPLVCAADIQELEDQNSAATLHELIRERQNSDLNRHAAGKIKEAYEASLVESQQREEQRKQIREAKDAKAAANKLEKIKQVIERLSACVDDSKEWKEVALEVEWKESWYHSASTQTPHFKISLVQSMMSKLFLESSGKPSTACLAAIAQKITEIFDKVYRKGYHKLKFLSFDRFDKILRQELLRRGGWAGQSILSAAVASVANRPKTATDAQIKVNIVNKLLASYDCAPCLPGFFSATNIPEGKRDLATHLATGIWRNNRQFTTGTFAYYRECCTSLFPQWFQNVCSFMQAAAAQGHDFPEHEAGFVWAEDWKMIELLSAASYQYSAVLKRALELHARLPQLLGRLVFVLRERDDQEEVDPAIDDPL